MKSLRQAIQKSWFPQMSLIRGDVATSLGLSSPLSLNELTRHLDQPETISLRSPLDADALHGAVEVILRSDGTYTFRGHLRATGFPSFDYTVQVFIRSGGDAVLVALATSGRVFGTDTPGDRSRSWDESGSSPFVREYWMALRRDAKIETNLDKGLSGVSGGLVDIAKTVFETYIAAQTGGIIGAVIVLGSELGAAAGQTFINPNILAGVTVGAGILIVFGPSAIIPAVAAGVTTGLLAGIGFRRMNEGEVTLANKVFGNKLPIDRIWITDLYNPSIQNGIAREFVVPGIDGSILVNMGKNFDHTLEPDVQGRTEYAKPGEVLIHELTHAWQIHHTSFLPGLLCKGAFGGGYDYDLADVALRKPWSEFGLEVQAHIVEDWFGLHSTSVVGGKSVLNSDKLESSEALSDARFHYVSRNIRLGSS